MRKSSEDRVLYLLKSRGAQTASDAGAALGMSTPGAQQHLARLAGRGLVEAESRPRPRGRPRKYWRLTEKGQARFPDRHSDLALELLRSAGEVFGAEGMERLIRHRERATLAAYRDAMAACESLEDRVRMLVALRTREGYMAEWSEPEPGRYLLVENHCPVCAAARQCQGLCRSELDIFRAVLGPGVEVERVEHVLAGARRCAYVVSTTPGA